MGMGRCCSLDWLVRQGDTPDEARIKLLFCPFSLFCFPMGILVVVNSYHVHGQIINIIGVSLIALVFALFMVCVTSNIVRAGFILDVVLGLLIVGICASDLATVTRTSTFRPWTYAVLCLDAALIFKRDKMPHFMLPFLLLYNIALQVESVSRFGLFELGYLGTAGVEDNFANCPSPPCDVSFLDTLIYMLGVCTVFLGDFYFTNGFATGMRLQLRRVE
eukprot:Hpha_TRINITY_DN15384_c3_g2::TRINITY_DN15384_c3_g2_i5::g.88067::m.88067